MLRGLYRVCWVCLAVAAMLLSGCAVRQQVGQEESPPAQEAPTPPVSFDPPPRHPSKQSARKKNQKDDHAVRRVISEKELKGYEARDTDLHFQRCVEILAKVNGKDAEYIRDDIKHKRAIWVPKDFSEFKNWTPLPVTLSGVDQFPKFILIVKDISFLGWYENGRLAGDTYVCIGKMNAWTKRGVYRVKAKDPSHMSTYQNAYGAPALMPFALHIYDRVWIHAGDVIGSNCSHGCINVPLYTADMLYYWTDMGTPVLITESLKDLGKDMNSGLPKSPKPGKAGPPEKADARGDSLKTFF